MDFIVYRSKIVDNGFALVMRLEIVDNRFTLIMSLDCESLSDCALVNVYVVRLSIMHE